LWVQIIGTRLLSDSSCKTGARALAQLPGSLIVVLNILPLMPSLSDLFKRAETRHRTLFTVTEDQAKIDALVEATQSVVGDLEQPNTGFLFGLSVSQVYGRSKL
jgi:hypothetical protein